MFGHQELQQMARKHEGELGEIPFALLLHSLAVSESNTVLEIRRKQLCKEIVIEDGVPVDCHSNLAHETLGRFMVNTGRIDESTFNTCFAESCSRAVTLGDVLIDKGLINAEELIKVLQQNLARKLLDGFTWREGSFKIHSDFPDVFSPLKVNVAQLIILGLTRFATQQQIDSSIGPLIGKALAVNPQPFYSPEEIKLSEAMKVVMNALDDHHQRIDELAASIGLAYEDLTRLLYALTLTGMVVAVDQLPAQPPVRQAARPPGAATVSEIPKPAISAQDRDGLMKLVLNYRRKDAFELLAIEPGATVAEIQQSYLKLAEKTAPWRFEPALAEKARDLFLAAARSYTLLLDPEQRHELEARRQRPAPDTTKPVRDQFRIKTSLLDPQVQFREAKTLIDQGSFHKAIVQLEYAVDLDSQNSEYRAELAYCRFLASPAAADSALEQLRETLRIDARCGLASYYQGEILLSMGRTDEAEEQLKLAIKPMAPDRRPIDTLRRLASERKQRGRK